MLAGKGVGVGVGGLAGGGGGGPPQTTPCRSATLILHLADAQPPGRGVGIAGTRQATAAVALVAQGAVHSLHQGNGLLQVPAYGGRGRPGETRVHQVEDIHGRQTRQQARPAPGSTAAAHLSSPKARHRDR